MVLVNGTSGNYSYAAFQALCNQYGAKAAGLSFLPLDWRLPFCCLSISVHEVWKSGRSVARHSDFKELWKWLQQHGYEDIIVRSSGVSETLYDRGKFVSRMVCGVRLQRDVVGAIHEIFEQARDADNSESLGLVVQEYLDPSVAGHLSNEYRVSPTINQWKYEIERPTWMPAKGLNSKQAPSPDPNGPIKCGNGLPHQSLRCVGNFLAAQFAERCHVEWIVKNGTLWLVQLDLEWADHDRGYDPRNDWNVAAPPALNLDAASILRPFRVDASTRWNKLQNLQDFDFGAGRPAPRIYPLEPQLIEKARQDASLNRQLVDEMVSLTGDRMVVRTDCSQEGVEPFNLPRTDTVTAREALCWCIAKLAEFKSRGIQYGKFIFLFHAFLPAKAAAWAYATPSNPTVFVDALWGLPDGLQVLPVDTYEINIHRQTIVETKSTHKPRFLTEWEDGTWGYQDVRSRLGRGRVLSRRDALEVATRTKNIADKLKDDAQIMWFCTIPEGYRVGRNLPWFRSREKFDEAPRYQERYKPFVVRSSSELDHLPSGNFTIKLLPEANLIRNDEFLDRVIEIAKDRNLPVEVQGSILGHTYYKLNKAAVPVILANAPKYYRKRQAQTFGKIVRDKIPSAIAAGGEAVVESRLNRNDLCLALSGKLIEELEEFVAAKTIDDREGELADLLEVMRGVAMASGIDWDRIVSVAQAKREKRGGFSDGRVLIETSLPRPSSPLETQKYVRLSDLGVVESDVSKVEIPATSLIGTAAGGSVTFSFLDDADKFSVTLKQGKLVVRRIGKQEGLSPKSQLGLFDYEADG